jgi:N-acetylglucosamine kinase-like BadF-type ATPase
MSQPILLGVDGGGTTTVAWLADPTGNVLGRGRSGPSNAKAVGLDTARRSLQEAIGQAFADAGLSRTPAEVACLGLAGWDRPADKALLRAWASAGGWAKRIIAVNDGDLLLAAGTPEGWGIGVIAGTGSIAVGRAPDGRIARAGGWGYLFGDEGSAYDVAVRALRWVARVADGRDPAHDPNDMLIGRICEAIGATQPEELITALYRPEVDRKAVAALAPIVVGAAEERSEAAGSILQAAADELVLAVRAVARKLRLLESPQTANFPLVLAGGFLLSSAPLSSLLAARLHVHGITPSAVTPVPDPVFGALTLARRALES